MKYNIGLGTLDRNGKSWRIRFSISLENGSYVRIARQFIGNKRDADAYRAKLRELLAYAVPSKPEGVTIQEWVKTLESKAVNKPEGVSWSAWLQQLEDEEKRKAGMRTLEQYATSWHQYRADNAELSKSTIEQDAQIIKRINKYLGSYELDALTPDIIKATYTKMREDGLTDDAVLRFHKKLKQILTTATEDELILKNPITKHRVPTPKAKPVTERVSLSLPKAVELQGVLDEAGDAESEPLAVRIGLVTGLRIGEVVGLTWSDFDFTAGVLKVRKQYNRTSRVCKLKTKASTRNVSVDDDTLKHLFAWKDNQKQYLAELRITQNDETPIITNQIGGFYDPDILRRWFRRFCVRNGFGAFFYVDDNSVAVPTEYEVDKRGGKGSKRKYGNGRDENGKPYSRMNKKPKRSIHYEGLKFHELRHTQATLLLASGEDIKTVQARLGHSKASTTLDMYAHAMPEKDRECATLIGDLLNGNKTIKALAL